MTAMSAADPSAGHRKKRSALAHLLLIFFGLLIAVGLLEIGLRVIGLIVRHGKAAAVEQEGANAAPYRTLILCVGDSHTAGLQAAEGLDYYNNHLTSQLAHGIIIWTLMVRVRWSTKHYRLEKGVHNELRDSRNLAKRNRVRN